jgi:hypothetical protein
MRRSRKCMYVKYICCYYNRISYYLAWLKATCYSSTCHFKTSSWLRVCFLSCIMYEIWKIRFRRKSKSYLLCFMHFASLESWQLLLFYCAISTKEARGQKRRHLFVRHYATCVDSNFKMYILTVTDQLMNVLLIKSYLSTSLY